MTRFANRLGYAGAGTGLAMFVMFGLYQGLYIGGTLGLNMANGLMGVTQAPTFFHRALTGLGMLAGAAVEVFMFVAASACIGWLMGIAIDSVLGRVKGPEGEVHRAEHEERRN